VPSGAELVLPQGALGRAAPAARVDAPAPILAVAHLGVTLGGRRILEDLSFDVRRGDALAILGPNGCGKTVLFQALVGSIPHTGEVRWAPGSRLGYVPQKLDLERDLPLTGRDLLDAKRRLLHAADDPVALAARVGLARELSQPIGALSGGQFQRLLVALALVGHPDVLLLDEFTAGVDAPGQEFLTELVRRLREEDGLTILSVSHDLSVVLRDATQVLCLSRTRATLGPPTKILTPELLRELYGTPVEFHVHGH